MKKLVLLVPFVLAGGCQLQPPATESRFRVPADFEVETVASPEQVGSLVQLTFDARGDLVVAKERSHPVRLLDEDGDGYFETEQVVSDRVSNCQGIWFDGPTLYANCTSPEDGGAYLFRLPDADGDGVADSAETVFGYTGRIGEHGPHDIRRAPDGSITVLLGNRAFVDASRIAPSSPLQRYGEGQLLERYMDPRGHAAGVLAPGGVLIGLLEGGRRVSLEFGGFRNPYNHAYNYLGEVFTFDSDMEWDLNLPWYREVRSVHGVPSADYGWRTGSGKFPSYYVDSLPPVDELGRGSPVGVDFYHSYAYPPEYFDAFLQGDWSRGRVVLSRFRRSGATYELDGPATDFVYGEPLNVTDVEVGPDGMVYFAMGGRQTRGGVHRVRYTGRRGNADRLPLSGMLAVVRRPQPLSAFSDAYFRQTMQAMGAGWAAGLEALVRDESAEAADRVQALHLLHRYGPPPGSMLLRAALADPAPEVRAAAVYLAGRSADGSGPEIVTLALRDGDPLVRRRAVDALQRGRSLPSTSVGEAYALLGDPDRFVRWSARVALERVSRASWEDRVIRESDPLAAATGMLALLRTGSTPLQLEAVFEKTASLLRRPGLPAEAELALLRVAHLACIQLPEGCRSTIRNLLYDIVAARFPAEDERLNREYALTMAYSGLPPAIGRILGEMPAGDGQQALQIHYVYALRAIRDGWSTEQKQLLVAWFQKAAGWRGGASFAGFVNLLFESCMEFFEPAEREAAYAAVPDFAPVEDQAQLEALRRRNGHVQPSVFSRRRGTDLYSEQEVFEYMMYDPMTTLASVEDGARVFEEVCAECHRHGAIGRDFGPDLTTIANRFSREDLLEATLWPSRTISDQYTAWRIETRTEVYSVLIAAQDSDAVTVLLPEVERPVRIDRNDIVAMDESEVSLMPEGLLDTFDLRESAGLFRLLEQAGTESR